jgi:arylsulfatase
MKSARRFIHAAALAALCVASASQPGAAQQIRGAPGAPDALMTLNGFSLPVPSPPFTGAIMPNAGESQIAWRPQVAAPEGASDVLVILTDDVGFGGVIPTPGSRPCCGAAPPRVFPTGRLRA